MALRPAYHPARTRRRAYQRRSSAVSLHAAFLGALLLLGACGSDPGAPLAAAPAATPPAAPAPTVRALSEDVRRATPSTPTPSPATRTAAPAAPGESVALVVNTVATGLSGTRRIAVGTDGTIVLASNTQLLVDRGHGPQLLTRLPAGDVLGLALEPGDGAGRAVYVLLGAYNEERSEVRRFTLEGPSDADGDVLAQWERRPSWSGNALAFGGDGTLYAAVAPPDAAGGIEALLEAAVVNTFEGHPLAGAAAVEAACVPLAGSAAVWERIEVAPSTPVGARSTPAARDVSRGAASRDAQPGVQDAAPAPGVPLAGTGGVVGTAAYGARQIPQWAGSAFAVTRGGSLLRLTADAGGCADAPAAELLYPEHGDVLDIAAGPDGGLYLLATGESRHSTTTGGRLLRIVPEASLDLRYPDMRTQPPSNLAFGQALVDGEWRTVLRFTNIVMNLGEGPLDVRASGNGEEVVQRIYAADGTYVERHSGEIVYHWSHGHWHFENFNRFELWTREDYEAYLAGADTEPHWVEDKVSMCLMDILPVDEGLRGYPGAGVYGDECADGAQGISVGWADIYFFDVPEQWVSLSGPMPEGDFVLRSVVDSENLFYESPDGRAEELDSRDSNGATIWFSIRAGAVSVQRSESAAGPRWSRDPTASIPDGVRERLPKDTVADVARATPSPGARSGFAFCGIWH